MELKLHLPHPRGKRAVRISKTKYETLIEAMMGFLRRHGQATFSENTMATSQNSEINEVAFEGALNGCQEWVKLNPEANTSIRTVPTTSHSNMIV